MLMTEGYQSWLMRTDPLAVMDVLAEALTLSAEALYDAPSILQHELLFPYTTGRTFAYTLFVAGDGWGGVNAAYTNLPLSTEHILHPERYTAGDAPQPVTVAALDGVLGQAWRLVWERTLGEFHLREHLQAVIPRERASAAAAGWGGDRYRIYFDDDTEQTVLLWRIRWDTAAEASEFHAAYREYGALRSGEGGTAPDTATTCWPVEPDGMLCLRAGAQESLIALAPADVISAVLAAAGPAP